MAASVFTSRGNKQWYISIWAWPLFNSFLICKEMIDGMPENCKKKISQKRIECPIDEK